MKKTLKALKAMTVLAGLMIVQSAWSYDLSGVRIGKPNDKKDSFLLFANPILGRDGSYLAVLSRVEKGLFGDIDDILSASLYRIDPMKGNKFDMTPLRVTPDGSIGVTNVDPSLVLTMISDKSFVIAPANSGNTSGFQGTISFDGSTERRATWSPYVAGDYRAKGGLDSQTLASLSPFDGVSFRGTGEFSIQNVLTGSYELQEKQPGFFALKAVSVKSTGSETQEYPQKIAFFMRNSGDLLLILVDPSNERNLKALRLK